LPKIKQINGFRGQANVAYEVAPNQTGYFKAPATNSACDEAHSSEARKGAALAIPIGLPMRPNRIICEE